MTGAAGLRDSTQIVLPIEALEGLRGELERRFVLTVVENDCRARLIGSPVEIKDASDWLARRGVFVA